MRPQSGVPFWAWDMAGFTGTFPSSELYLRAAAQQTFSPIMQYHSEKSAPATSEARTPWNVQARTGDTSVIPSFRKFANTRMNLVPYLYTEAKTSSDTGLPMMQAMDLAYPADPATATLDQQYMLGKQLLVAPVTTQGATSKDVYLPAGEWYDFWNGGRAVGPMTKTYNVGTDSIPFYAKAGAIVPLNLNANYELGGNIGNSVYALTNLVFRVYPQGTTNYGYWDDAASVTRTVTSTEAWASHQVTVSVPALTTKSTLQVSSTQLTTVTRDGSTLTEYSSISVLAAATEGWYWDPIQQLTHVKTPSSGSARSIVLNGVDKASYEAEFGTRVGTATNTNNLGFTGTGFVDSFDASGDSVSVDINVATAGDYALRFRYANATGVAATRTLYVDGVASGTVTLPNLANLEHLGQRIAHQDADRRETHDEALLGHRQRTSHQPRQHDGGPTMTQPVTRPIYRIAVLAFVIPLLLALSLVNPPKAHAATQRAQFLAGGNYLIVEFLDDYLVHFELGQGTGPGTGTDLFATAQVSKRNYPGPTSYSLAGSTMTTAALQASVDTTTVCATVYDTTKTPDLLLHTACPRNITQAWKGLSFTKSAMQNAYGLGKQFFPVAVLTATGSAARARLAARTATPWSTTRTTGRSPTPRYPCCSPSEVPTPTTASLVDQFYKQQWDLNGDPWTMDTFGDQIRWYVMAGADLPDLRKDYMELTGRPPVPPKKAFGLWNSEYGYDSWTEVDNMLATLRAAKFPIDGFMLDVNWFGGVTAGSDATRMGTLAWDSTNFPSGPKSACHLLTGQQDESMFITK